MLSLFEGFEAEGRWRGLKTLFIPATMIRADEDRTEVAHAIQSDRYAHLYFGAGDHPILDEEDWARAMELVLNWKDYCITFEVTLNALHYSPAKILSSRNCRIFIGLNITTNLTPDQAQAIEVKLVDTQHAHCFSHENSADLIYLKDKPL